jgi:tetratricopeptide (TPR) repeat protein
MYGVALRAHQNQTLLDTTQRLLALDLEDAEVSALSWQRYDLLLEAGDAQGARAALEAALVDPRCVRWAPVVSSVQAALRHDHDLLQRAHARLAELATTPANGAAHLCAQARALLRMGRSRPAIEVLQHALRQSPGNVYAVALLEELLHAQGDSTEAVYLLREAAATAIDARRGELSLLHAGAMAEAAGNAELAARSYEEAADLDPDGLSPLWGLRRIAERSDNRSLELTALEGLCVRQAKHGAANVERLELAALYDLMDQPDLAAAPLRRP